ncbi:MAG: hypothetical protein SPI85_00415 [Ellagibacter isourolithinifaciens]|uniref:hypothetical protein n=1 Tax=Ellagibacter isourolithinifaciens TaxID=2137581 RepID=UPI002A9147A0|nr:hypothetical protein [Ellagibacter isourolithinifaciens]MDY6111246.1 hypothetical protein [Ellagibacter isourolithinifaciens]
MLENGGHCFPQQLQFDFPSEKRLDGMIEGTIASIDDSLHNLDYHELKNAEGESWRLIDRTKSAFRVAWIFVAAGAAWACRSRIAFRNLQAQAASNY